MIPLDKGKKYKMEADFYSSFDTTRGQGKIIKIQYTNLLGRFKFVFSI